MDELVFKSKLTVEEIEQNFKDFDLAKNLEISLLEILEYKKTQRKEKINIQKDSLSNDFS